MLAAEFPSDSCGTPRGAQVLIDSDVFFELLRKSFIHRADQSRSAWQHTLINNEEKTKDQNTTGEIINVNYLCGRVEQA